ncbi:disease resistance protein RPM1-like [Silene latifolia]|uniref:disease resistance protein RPM1-like n=1 Tax=Silene latifolia TaxID=37657 RepID=UPI003D77E477
MSDIYGPIQIVLQLLGPLIQSEVSLFSNLKDDVNAIKIELQNISGYLINAEDRAEGDDAAKDWLNRVREFAFDIEDAIERYQLLLNERKISKFKHYIKGDIKNMASTIKSLRGCASSISGAGDRFRFISENGTQHGQFNNQGTLRPTLNNCTMTSGYEVVVDETAKGEIVDLLGFQNATRTPSTVAVVAMRGLGKTTVVESVYYDKTIRSQFPLRAWIPMSECRQQDAIIRSMIVQFSSATSNKIVVDGMDERSLLSQLQKYIQGKRYMVVFDNVQQEDTDLTKHIRGLLDTNKEKSKILITTRYENEAHAWLNGLSNSLYKLKPLPSNKAWELFLKKTFQGSGERCPSPLHDLASGIVEKCGGVPPVIIAVGNLLSNRANDFNEWSKVHNALAFYLNSNRQLSGMYRAFMQIYYELPFHLRPCFLYFGLFPENYPIGRMRLLRLWISEGFIREHRRDLTLEEVAEEYMNELINMSMVEVKSRDPSGKVKTLGVVSKFLHELILSKLDELSFCKILSPKGSFGQEKSRRLSIYKNHESHALELDKITKNPSSIRSLFLEDVEQPIMLKAFDNKFLESISLLRVLDLINAPIHFIPKEVGKLLNLRYLSLRGTRVSRIPKTIGNLENLQTLDLKHTRITELPKEFIQLHNLRHLLGYYYEYNMLYDPHCMKIHGVKIPEGLLGKCLQLQKLAFMDLNAGLKNWVTELKKQKQLRKLGIIGLKASEGNDMCSLIDEMKYLQALNILSKSKCESIDLRNVKSPPQMLKRLYLSGPLLSFPTWICKLDSLVKIRLRWSNLPIDPLVSLELLPNLAELQLLEAFTGEHLNISSHGFQKLKVLHLLNLHSLRSLSIAKGALPLLSELSIGESKNLEVPSDIKHLHILKTLNFYDMPSDFINQFRSGKPCYSIIKHVPSIFIRNKHPNGWQTETI